MTAAVSDEALRRRLSSAGLARVRGRTWARTVDDLASQHYTAVLAPMEIAA
ncbi:MAG: hypothetical protein ACRDO0_11865 [Nocardioidaceae bacterium]